MPPVVSPFDVVVPGASVSPVAAFVGPTTTDVRVGSRDSVLVAAPTLEPGSDCADGGVLVSSASVFTVVSVFEVPSVDVFVASVVDFSVSAVF